MTKGFKYWFRCATVCTLTTIITFNPAWAGRGLRGLLSKRSACNTSSVCCESVPVAVDDCYSTTAAACCDQPREVVSSHSDCCDSVPTLVEPCAQADSLPCESQWLDHSPSVTAPCVESPIPNSTLEGAPTHGAQPLAPAVTPAQPAPVAPAAEPHSPLPAEGSPSDASAQPFPPAPEAEETQPEPTQPDFPEPADDLFAPELDEAPTAPATPFDNAAESPAPSFDPLPEDAAPVEPADELFDAPEETAPALPSNDPFGAPTAPADDFFGNPTDDAAPALPAEEDVFGTPPAEPLDNDDFFGTPDAPPISDADNDIFGNPAGEEPAAADSDIFGNPTSEATEDTEQDIFGQPTATGQAADSYDDLFGTPQTSSYVEPADVKAQEADQTKAELDIFRSTRTWHDNTGLFQVDAKLVAIFADSVRLLKENGNFCTLSLRRLSQDDKRFVEHVAGILPGDGAKFVSASN